MRSQMTLKIMTLIIALCTLSISVVSSEVTNYCEKTKCSECEIPKASDKYRSCLICFNGARKEVVAGVFSCEKKGTIENCAEQG